MRTRYAIAGAIAALVGVGAAVAAPGSIRPPATSPPPRQLVADAAEAALAGRPHAGWVRAKLDLSLPALPQSGLASIPTNTSARVWREGAFVRVSEAQPFGERSFVSGPSGTWTWDSAGFSSRRLGPNAGPLLVLAGFADPRALTAQAFDAVAPSTAVSTGPPAVVAGRGAHVLVLRPRTTETLIGRVEVSLDATRHVPLGVAVFSREAESPSLSVAFESVSFDAIPREIFDFHPPAGSLPRSEAKGEQTVGADGGGATGQGNAQALGGGLLEGWRLLGSGWASAAALKLDGATSPILAEFLPFQGDLITVDVVTVGGARWLVAGPVPLEHLEVLARELE
ncbi:MAG: hypothetical protein M3454_13385 [Actinomycetota bacterium]|nr:hypothetical protein [Actinomycetota bacterium]